MTHTLHILAALALLFTGSFSCKPRLQGKNGAGGSSSVATAPDGGSPNRTNLLAGLSMVTQGAIQAGGGNPESLGVGDPKNFDAASWDQSFKTLSADGLFGVQSTENRKDSITWQWQHDSKAYKGTYIVDRRKMGDKRFLLIRLCRMDIVGATSPELFAFCGIASLDNGGQISKAWTLCSGLTPSCDK